MGWFTNQSASVQFNGFNVLKPFDSEIFGASEDDSPEMDHSEDAENGRLALGKRTTY